MTAVFIDTSISLFTKQYWPYIQVCNVSGNRLIFFFMVRRPWIKTSGLPAMIKFKQRVMRLRKLWNKTGSPVCCWMVSLMFCIRVLFLFLPEVLIWYFCRSKRRDLNMSFDLFLLMIDSAAYHFKSSSGLGLDMFLFH